MSYAEDRSAVKRLTKDIEQAEADTDAWKWERAERLSRMLETKTTQAVADDVGMSAKTVRTHAKVWLAYTGAGASFTEAYYAVTGDSAKFGKGGGRNVKEKTDTVEQLLGDPDVQRELKKRPAAVEVVEDMATDVWRKQNERDRKAREARDAEHGTSRPAPDEQPVRHRQLVTFMLESQLISERALEHGFEDDETRDIALALAGRIRKDMTMLAEAAKGGTRVTEQELESLLEGGM